MIVPRTLVIALALACSLPAAAQTLYKMIDKNGKVTYSESPPKEFDGQVIRMDIDPKANTATLPKGDAIKAPVGEAAAQEPPLLREARVKVDQAQRRLKDARDNPGPDDIQRIGNVGGGARAVPSESYTRRLAELEEDVRKAEEEVRRLQPPPKK